MLLYLAQCYLPGGGSPCRVVRAVFTVLLTKVGVVLVEWLGLYLQCYLPWWGSPC